MKLIDVPVHSLKDPAAGVPDPSLVYEAPASQRPATLSRLRQRFADYAELTKPRLTLMVLFTVAVGYAVGGAGNIDWLVLTHTLLGTALVAAGASALNQYLESDTDALMRRTRQRPLPAGRLEKSTALRLGVLSACVGFGYLVLAVNALAALVSVVTLASYVFVYTPLKRVSTLNTLVGAVPGALPPLIGWAAATGTLPLEALGLFLLLFLWQFPHFWAIAWLHREDYARAGLRMLAGQDAEGGRMTGRLMLQSCLALVVASLGPAIFGLTGPRYVWCAVVLGGVFAAFVVRFLWHPDNERARHVLWASLLYLPVVLLALVLDGPLFGVIG